MGVTKRKVRGGEDRGCAKEMRGDTEKGRGETEWGGAERTGVRKRRRYRGRDRVEGELQRRGKEQRRGYRGDDIEERGQTA